MKLPKILSAVLLLLGFSAQGAIAQCQAQYERVWGKAHIYADALGADCGKSVLVLTVRDVKGNVLWASVHRSVDLLSFQDSGKLNAQSMKARLGEWVAEQQGRANSGALPDWPSSAKDGTLPPEAEFPFRVAEGMERKDYLLLRKAKLPVLCFVAGMESERCLVLNGSDVTEIGTQSFPG